MTRRPRALVAAGAALVAVAVGVAALQTVRADQGPARPVVPLDHSALAAVGTSGSVDAAVPLPGAGRVAVTDGLVWVGGDDSGTVSAIDAKTHRLVRTVPIGVFPSDIAAGAGSLWVVDGSRGRVVRIDPSYGRILETPRFKPSGEAPSDRFGFDPTSIAADDEGAWITDGSSRLLHVAADGDRERIPVGRPLVGVATGAGGVWAISGETAEVVRIDPRTREVTMRLPIVAAPQLASAFPRAVAAAGDVVWVLNSNTGAVTKIDPRTRSIVNTIPIGVERVPVQLAADAAALWVANEDGTLARVDAVSDEVRFHDVGRMLRDVTIGAGGIWATNRLGDCCGQEQ